MLLLLKQRLFKTLPLPPTTLRDILQLILQHPSMTVILPLKRLVLVSKLKDLYLRLSLRLIYLRKPRLLLGWRIKPRRTVFPSR